MVNTIPAALGPFTSSPTETPTQRPQGASLGQGAARFIRPPPRIHRPTLLHHLLPRHSPVSSSSNSPSADPSSLRRNRAEGGSTNGAPAGSLPHPQSQSQTQPQADPSASQTQTRTQALTPLPLVMPDTKLGSTTARLLLQDTQAHMEKFAARMDALGTHMEQSLREIQMCRAATEGASEKCVADIVDVVYKCQSNFIKKLEASDNMIQTQSDAIHRLSTVCHLSFTFASVTFILPRRHTTVSSGSTNHTLHFMHRRQQPSKSCRGNRSSSFKGPRHLSHL